MDEHGNFTEQNAPVPQMGIKGLYSVEFVISVCLSNFYGSQKLIILIQYIVN